MLYVLDWQVELRALSSRHRDREWKVTSRLDEVEKYQQSKIRLRNYYAQMVVKEKKNSHVNNFQDFWNMTKIKPTKSCWRRGANIQTNCIENLFTEIIPENFPNLGKDLDIQVQEAFRTPNRQDQKRTIHSWAVSGPSKKWGRGDDLKNS
jgi:hypothetical protein